MVTAKIVTRWTAPLLDTPARQEFVVLVTTRSLGGKNGVEGFDFEWEPKPENWGMSPPDMLVLEPGTLPDPLAIADVFNANKVLEDGEVSHKMFRLSAGNRPDAVDRPYDVTAVVRQSNGKIWKSEPVRIFPPEWFDRTDAAAAAE
ncbi:hypothetical protein BJQ89_02490 [Arthrobacter sp. ES1]|nr:hypothetical protein [Arthrobacter sp. ES1]